jgi:allophanate hydrolase
LLRAPGFSGPGIAGEIWLLSPADFGRFVMRVPAPMSIGKIELADGTQVSGFLVEAFAIEGAQEITSYGGWRAYIDSSP